MNDVQDYGYHGEALHVETGCSGISSESLSINMPCDMLATGAGFNVNVRILHSGTGWPKREGKALQCGLMMTGAIWCGNSVRSKCTMNPLKPRHLSA